MDFAEGFRFWSFDVFHKKLLALTGALLALTLLSAQPVLAQDPGMRDNETSDRASGNIRGDRVLPGRMSDGARERRDRRNRESEQEEAAAKAAATPEENRAAAHALLTAAGGNERPTSPPPAAVSGLVEPLTARELEVCRLVGLGHSNKRIARELRITEGTVKIHLNNIFRKLGVSSRLQVALAARSRGLL